MWKLTNKHPRGGNAQSTQRHLILFINRCIAFLKLWSYASPRAHRGMWISLFGLDFDLFYFCNFGAFFLILISAPENNAGTYERRVRRAMKKIKYPVKQWYIRLGFVIHICLRTYVCELEDHCWLMRVFFITTIINSVRKQKEVAKTPTSTARRCHRYYISIGS